MKKISVACAALFAVVSVAAAKDCEAPQSPSFDATPDAVSRSDMVAMFRTVKSFQAQSANYRDCLAERQGDMDAQSLTKLHNASVDAEEAVAVKFNALFNAFKERSQAAR